MKAYPELILPGIWRIIQGHGSVNPKDRILALPKDCPRGIAAHELAHIAISPANPGKAHRGDPYIEALEDCRVNMYLRSRGIHPLDGVSDTYLLDCLQRIRAHKGTIGFILALLSLSAFEIDGSRDERICALFSTLF